MARLIIVEDNTELASLIRAAASPRGYEVVIAHSVREALEAIRASTFDVALVDLLLPDLPGTRVLDALQGSATRAVMMSGLLRDPRAAREVREVHGAAAIFVKPFELGALLAELDRLSGAAFAASEAELGLDDFAELDALAPVEDAPLSPRAKDDFDLPFARREQVWGGARERAEGAALPAWTPAGPLVAGSVPRLLTASYQARHTGELKLCQGRIVKVVCFEGGVPIYAASNLAGERFARFCARRGMFPESELQAIATLAKDANLRTGEAMVKRGLISPDQRAALLVEQVKEIVWSTFSWAQGEFSFSRRRPRASDLVRLEVFPGDLILEGVRRTESLVSLRRKVAADRRLFPNSNPPYELHQVRLDGTQARLLAHADGTKTVSDLLALTDLAERDALATLWGLELLGILEERQETRAPRRISFGL